MTPKEQTDAVINAMHTKYKFRLMWWLISMQRGKISRFSDYVNDGMCGNAAIEKVIKNDSI